MKEIHFVVGKCHREILIIVQQSGCFHVQVALPSLQTAQGWWHVGMFVFVPRQSPEQYFEMSSTAVQYCRPATQVARCRAS